MSANANGTPTTNFSIPKFNTPSDAPNGKGVNEMMDAIDVLLPARLTTTGDMLYSSSGATTSRLGIGGSGTRLTSNGSTPAWRTPARGRGTIGGAYASTSGVGTMIGIATPFTPAVGTLALLIAFGQVYNSTGAAGHTIQLYYGTGTAPTLGAAQTGSGAGFTQSSSSLANIPVPFTLADFITVTPGTTYWVDLSLSTSSGTGQISNPFVLALEL